MPTDFAPATSEKRESPIIKQFSNEVPMSLIILSKKAGRGLIEPISSETKIPWRYACNGRNLPFWIAVKPFVATYILYLPPDFSESEDRTSSTLGSSFPSHSKSVKKRSLAL